MPHTLQRRAGGQQHERRLLRLAVFTDHSGNVLQPLLAACEARRIPAVVAVAISDAKDSVAHHRAHDHFIPTVYFPPHDHGLESKLIETLKHYKVDIIVQAGYGHRIPNGVLRLVKGWAIAILPSLDVAVALMAKRESTVSIQAPIIAAQLTKAGASVVFLSENDQPGSLLLQGYVPVLAGDTADRLARRVIAAQQILAPQAIQLIERVYWSNNAVPQTKRKAS